MEGPRLSVRGIVLRDGRLLMVNAWPDGRSDLICAPGGGVDRGQSLPDNLVREIHEETGLTVQVGPVVLVNEFNDPAGAFHQVDVFFRCQLVSGDPDGEWTDVGGVVTRTLWLTRDELARHRYKPDSLPDVAWGIGGEAVYDALEPIVR
ncbi:MAG: NUDIX domain-containing protein [Boseongicola sp.]|nr:NUDIX domain-containing protein [Boseongicola sp.]